METRASYVAVGTFVLVLAAALVGFVLWLAAVSFNDDRDTYIVYFTGSVTGLQIATPVRYSGISVGQVREVGIDARNPRRVRVLVDLLPGTPVVEDSVATLEVAGITGGVFIQIAAGMSNQLLTAPADEPYPVIPSRPPATIGSVVASLPDLLEEATVLLQGAQGFLSEENQRAVTEILVSVQAIAESVADNRDAIATTLQRTNTLLANVDDLVVEVQDDVTDLLANANDLLETADTEVQRLAAEFAATAQQIRTMSQSFAGTAQAFTGLITETQPGVSDFTNVGLEELTLTLGELRLLAQNLSRIILQMEQRGTANFLLGDTDQGVEVE